MTIAHDFDKKGIRQASAAPLRENPMSPAQIEAIALQKAANLASQSSIESPDDLEILNKLRGGSTEVTSICDDSFNGKTSVYHRENGKLEFSRWTNTRIRGIVAKQHYTIGVFLDSKPNNHLLKSELSEGDFIFFKPNNEREALYVDPMEGAFIHVDPEHFERLIETRGIRGGVEGLPTNLHAKLPKALSQFLISSSRRCRNELAQHSSANDITERAIAYAYDHFLDNIIDCLAVSVGARFEARDATPDAYKLLSNVEQLMRESPGDIVSINQLCDNLRVSRATLRKGFAETLGVSPGMYIRNWRLSRAREGLQQLHFGSVTEAALHWGFFDCGRFSGYYFQLFNELPSATLKQARRAVLG